MTDVDTGADEPKFEGPNLHGSWILDRDDGNFENYLRENGTCV